MKARVHKQDLTGFITKGTKMTRCSACANKGAPCYSCRQAMNEQEPPLTLNTNPTRERLTENQRKREKNK